MFSVVYVCLHCFGYGYGYIFKITGHLFWCLQLRCFTLEFIILLWIFLTFAAYSYAFGFFLAILSFIQFHVPSLFLHLPRFGWVFFINFESRWFFFCCCSSLSLSRNFHYSLSCFRSFCLTKLTCNLSLSFFCSVAWIAFGCI